MQDIAAQLDISSQDISLFGYQPRQRNTHLQKVRLRNSPCFSLFFFASAAGSPPVLYLHQLFRLILYVVNCGGTGSYYFRRRQVGGLGRVGSGQGHSLVFKGIGRLFFKTDAKLKYGVEKERAAPANLNSSSNMLAWITQGHERYDAMLKCCMNSERRKR